MRFLAAMPLVLALGAAPPPPVEVHIRIPAWLETTTAPSPKDFTAQLDGKPARVVSVRGPADDLMLLIVLDLSDDLTLADTAKEALAAEVERLPEHAYVALLRAQDGLTVLAEPTPDRQVIARAALDLAPSGRAGFLDTVETALGLGDAIQAKSSVRVAVLYITDSSIQNYRRDYTNPVINSSDSHDLSRRFPEGLVQDEISKLEEKLASRQTPLFVVHLKYRSDPLNEAYQNGLKQLSDATAGTSAFCRSFTDVAASIQAAFASIGSQYSIEIALPPRLPRTLQVQLTLSEEKGRSLNYRARLARKKE